MWSRAFLYSGFGYLTNLLMELADGKLVLALEGGFELEPLCDSVETCVRALLDGKKYVKLSDQALTSFPNRHAVNCINEAIRIQSKCSYDTYTLPRM